MDFNAPPKHPDKLALNLLNTLLTSEVLKEGVMFDSRRSTKAPLGRVRVDKIFGMCFYCLYYLPTAIEILLCSLTADNFPC